jgi:hypothetical protein
MKRIMLFLLILFILSLMFAGCAQFSGTAPDGETGGGNDGYGNENPDICINWDKSTGDFCGYFFLESDYWRI